MSNAIYRIKENKFYILYKRKLEKNECMAKYFIKNTEEFGGVYLGEYYSLTQAKKVFNKATKEALQYAKELLTLTSY